ncbi:MAG TPA: hypothetical protein VFQ91_24715 [Bryobacteraceae bacterium]|nr:hypothetical protein [Bryobacteraceae bacterium]
MPTKVTAKNGDCLCGIASDFGFFDCKPLRDVGENSAFLNRPLQDGDEVTVPDITVEDHQKPVDAKHTFKLKTSPPVNIRFVHGSPNLPYRDDSETVTLHVSNFVTDLGGADGLKALPKGYGFNDDGHQDPDTFKVEVWDPAAGGSVNVVLEALKPVYTADPITGALTVTSYADFGDAKRKIDALVCNQVSSTTANTYRSKYMRLVVDEEDRDNAGVTDQVLWVSDMADGLGSGAPGDNDTVEILDQMVRASYEVQRCSGSPKCKVVKTVEIGGSERQRVRLHFYAVRQAVGGAAMPTGVSTGDVQKHLRRRTFRWYRRVFAQADLAPKLMSMNVVDPPPENMFCLSHSHGRPVSTSGVVQLDFRVKTDTRDLPVRIVFTGGETPLAAGAAIAGGLPVGFSGEALACVRATNAVNPSCDTIITADNGERVTLLDVQLSVGAGMTVDVPRVNLMSVISDDAAVDASVAFLTIDMKRLLRATPVTDDAMHCIVVGRFSTPGLRGQAFTDCHLADAAFQPALPFRSSTIMAYQAAGGSGFIGVLDNGDTLPFTSPHESAHTLCDLVHTKPGTNHNRTQLLGTGTSPANSVTATKRLCGGPYLVTMEQNLTTTMTHVQVKLVDKMRSHGAAKMEAW